MCIQGCQEISASPYIKDKRTVLTHIKLFSICTSFLSSSHIHWVESHRLLLSNHCVRKSFWHSFVSICSYKTQLWWRWLYKSWIWQPLQRSLCSQFWIIVWILWLLIESYVIELSYQVFFCNDKFICSLKLID